MVVCFKNEKDSLCISCGMPIIKLSWLFSTLPVTTSLSVPALNNKTKNVSLIFSLESVVTGVKGWGSIESNMQKMQVNFKKGRYSQLGWQAASQKYNQIHANYMIHFCNSTSATMHVATERCGNKSHFEPTVLATPLWIAVCQGASTLCSYYGVFWQWLGWDKASRWAQSLPGSTLGAGLGLVVSQTKSVFVRGNKRRGSM